MTLTISSGDAEQLVCPSSSHAVGLAEYVFVGKWVCESCFVLRVGSGSQPVTAGWVSGLAGKYFLIQSSNRLVNHESLGQRL